MGSRLRRFRPMGFADVLDEAFDLYKNNFVLFVGIGAIVYAPVYFLVGVSMTLLSTEFSSISTSSTAANLTTTAVLGGLIFLVVMLFLLTYPLVTGAFTTAISRRYLDEQTTIGKSYGAVWGRFGALIGTMLLYVLVVFGPVLLLGIIAAIAFPAAVSETSMVILAIPFAIIAIAVLVLTVVLSVRLAFAPAVVVLEDRAYSEALRRSWNLSARHGWRLFWIMVVTSIVVSVISGIIRAPVQILAKSIVGAAGAGTLAALDGASQAVAQSLMAPVAVIVLVLLYYDLRVRVEGFDLQMLARDLGSTLAENSSNSAHVPPSELAQMETQCAHCHFPIRNQAELKNCPSCNTAHHLSCWTANHGCAGPGCVAGPGNVGQV